jgi:hypothetical protein
MNKAASVGDLFHFTNVSCWPVGEVAARCIEVRSWTCSGLGLLTVSSYFDPEETFHLGASLYQQRKPRRLSMR